MPSHLDPVEHKESPSIANFPDGVTSASFGNQAARTRRQPPATAARTHSLVDNFSTHPSGSLVSAIAAFHSIDVVRSGRIAVLYTTYKQIPTKRIAAIRTDLAHAFGEVAKDRALVPHTMSH